MSWVTILWSMVSGVCATLAVIHLVAWLWERGAHSHLLFSLAAISVSALAGLELAMMRCQSIAEYAMLVLWWHVPVWVFPVLLVWFVRTYLNAGRLWLAWTICCGCTVILLLNFLGDMNFSFRAIRELRVVEWPWGEQVAVPVGSLHPWIVLGPMTLAFLFVYLADTARVVWCCRDRERAVIICGSAVLMTGLALVQSVLAAWGVVAMPLFLSFGFLGIIMAIGYGLSRDVFDAGGLTDGLRDNERQTDSVLAAAELGLWTWRVDGAALWLSKKARAQFGLEATEEVSPERLFGAIHPEDRARVRSDIDQAVQQRKLVDTEFRVIASPGQTRWIAARGGNGSEDRGGSKVLRVVTFDVSSRKGAEDCLVRVVDGAPNGIIMVDSAGRVILSNRQVERILGYSSREIVGKPVETLVPGYVCAAYAQLGGNGGIDGSGSAVETGLELVGVRKDGSKVHVEVAHASLETSEGQYILSSISNITDRKRTELEIARQRQELTRLSRAAVLGVLSGSLAHELNQPLTAILSNAQAAQRFLASEQADLAEVRQILADIVEDDKRAGNVISSLRLLLKSGEVNRELIAPNDLVRDTLRLLQSDLINSNVLARLELMHGPGMVEGNRVQLQQVLLNLIINACHAMQCETASRRAIVVGTRESGDAEIHITVRDHGCGIPVENLERVFEPFFTTRAEGMGLGLAVCRTIADAHGGRLWASNNDDGGASFHLALPAGQVRTT